MKRLAISLSSRALPVLVNPSRQQRLAVLIYHRVVPSRDVMRPDEPTVAEFDWQMRFLRNNFHPLPLGEAIERLREGSLPPRSVCVTFDDGYSDNETLALPILRKYEIPATVFVSTGFLNGGRMWNDTVIESVRSIAGDTLDLRELGLPCFDFTREGKAEIATSILHAIKHRDPQERLSLVQKIASSVGNLPDDLMMNDSQVQALHREGVAIGAHTVTHPILGRVSREAALEEIRESKACLENLLQSEVDLFAYPNGRPGDDYTSEHRDIVEGLGFKAAVSTHWGVAVAESDPYQIPRFTPWDREELKFALRLLINERNVDPLIEKSGSVA